MVKRRHIYIIIILVSLLSIIINIYNITRKDYYIGKIESIVKEDDITKVEVSPVASNRFFIGEIKENHHIEYADNIGISGISDPRKNSRRLKLGELGEIIDNLKVGDKIIFKVKKYNKNDYNIEIDELAVDLTEE